MNEINIDNPQDLPSAVFNLFFRRDNVLYKGKKLKFTFVSPFGGGRIKELKVGDYLYSQANPRANGTADQLAREGQEVLIIRRASTYEQLAYVTKEGMTKV